jgi:hypothetical protein
MMNLPRLGGAFIFAWRALTRAGRNSMMRWFVRRIGDHDVGFAFEKLRKCGLELRYGVIRSYTSGSVKPAIRTLPKSAAPCGLAGPIFTGDQFKGFSRAAKSASLTISTI